MILDALDEKVKECPRCGEKFNPPLAGSHQNQVECIKHLRARIEALEARRANLK